MPEIKFYLEGGGAKCIYQLTFLYYVFNRVNSTYTVKTIDTISFSSVIAFFILTDNFEFAKSIFITNGTGRTCSNISPDVYCSGNVVQNSSPTNCRH